MHRLLRLDRHECELQLVVRGEEAQERPGTTLPEGRAVLANRIRLPLFIHCQPTMTIGWTGDGCHFAIGEKGGITETHRRGGRC